MGNELPRLDTPNGQHLRVLNHPLTWQLKAKQIWIAANVLKSSLVDALSESNICDERNQLWGPYYMLSGMAIECLAKGLIIANGAFINKVSDFFGKEIKASSHDLTPLVKLAGISISPQESRVLKALTENIEWVARYPAATGWEKAYEQLDPKHNDGATIRQKKEGYCSRDFNKIAQIYTRLYDQLNSKIPLWYQNNKPRFDNQPDLHMK